MLGAFFLACLFYITGDAIIPPQTDSTKESFQVLKLPMVRNMKMSNVKVQTFFLIKKCYALFIKKNNIEIAKYN